MTREECIIFLCQVKHALLHSKSWLDSTHKPIQQALDMAIEALKGQKEGKWINDEDYVPQCSECGYVPSYIKILDKFDRSDWCPNCGAKMSATDINVRSKNEPRKLSNREWKEFLAKQFGISKTSAKEMLHGMMVWKKEDNFKRLFNPMNNNQRERREEKW